MEEYPSPKNTDQQVTLKTPRILSLENRGGRIPPSASDLEELILGAMMVDKKGVDEVIDILTPKVFYLEAHKLIFEAIHDLFSNTEPIDIKTVSKKLEQNKNLDRIGGDYYLIELSQKVSSSAHIEYHSRIIIQKYILRELISISAEISEKAFDQSANVFEVLDEAEQKIYDISQSNLRKSSESLQSLVYQALKQIREVSKHDGISGVPTGFSKLDEITSGWQASDLIIIAARPGMGKTAFVLSMIRNIAINHQAPVALFSLEMSSIQLITRLISSETEISSEKLRTGKLEGYEWDQLGSKVTDLEKAPIYIDDTPQLSIFDLRAKARRLCSQYEIKLIVIDYLQLMTLGSNASKTGNREQEISTISRNLKALAKELNLPIIALSQLSRAVETRGGSKRPILSDLRESGAIEQDADIVSFIYRPEYYGIEEWDDEEATSTFNQAEFIISKHRNGRLDDIRLKFTKELGKFEDLVNFGRNFLGNNQFESRLNQASECEDEGKDPLKDFSSDEVPF